MLTLRASCLQKLKGKCGIMVCFFHPRSENRAISRLLPWLSNYASRRPGASFQFSKGVAQN